MSETVTFLLNDKEIRVPKGKTVMEIAQQEKVFIPHFCYHKGLSIAGVCRFCMVEVKGRPKLEIACNLPITEGMVVYTQSEKVKEAHKWALEFHLVNHPLDCPVCDQAGECGLQDYYMQVGKYKSQMERPKVLKPKTLDVGSELVLDTERCILCSRCVRFEEEVTQTNGLGIFDRGDRAIIGTYNDEKITHEYQENIVDICPVGAFTSKSFRFKQRVWFLKEKKSICPGCSTGCPIEVHARPEKRTYYRVKPDLNRETDKPWICDRGRKTIAHLNPQKRLQYAYFKKEDHLPQIAGSLAQGIFDLKKRIDQTPKDQIALLIASQYTNEEYQSFLQYFTKLGVKNIYLWREDTENLEFFDGLLIRGDKNPNTHGLIESLKQFAIHKSVKNELPELIKNKPALTIALCPEVLSTFPSFEKHLQELRALPQVSVWGLAQEIADMECFSNVLPLKGFTEKKGTFVNYAGQEQVLNDPYDAFVSEAKDVTEIMSILESL